MIFVVSVFVQAWWWRTRSRRRRRGGRRQVGVRVSSGGGGDGGDGGRCDGESGDGGGGDGGGGGGGGGSGVALLGAQVKWSNLPRARWAVFPRAPNVVAAAARTWCPTRGAVIRVRTREIQTHPVYTGWVGLGHECTSQTTFEGGVVGSG